LDSRIIDPLVAKILGRSRCLFAQDIERERKSIEEAARGARILVIGAGGSIGAAFVKQLVSLAPAALHLVDINENSLVEVVRDVRSAPGAPTLSEFKSFSIDFASEDFARFCEAVGPWDCFINFAAIKHVRAERDPFSLMRMIDVNVGALHRALDMVAPARRIFSVSTDKSVRPGNLMGATKNLMERVLFCREGTVASSARFANVAMSAGSLLEGFGLRLAKRQPLSAPSDVRRYFIAAEEAALLCLAAVFTAGDREVFYPRLTPDEDLASLSDIAEVVLAHHGLEPLYCASEEEAKAAMDRTPGKWPCLFMPSDTTGEKMEEEFVRPTDRPDLERYADIGVAREAKSDRASIDSFLSRMADIRRRPEWLKQDIVSAIRHAVPDLAYTEVGRNLDQKM
jgi:FlaA1/EpsC-like NDP-sugar epimerase